MVNISGPEEIRDYYCSISNFMGVVSYRREVALSDPTRMIIKDAGR